jgi:hypothetical protein
MKPRAPVPMPTGSDFEIKRTIDPAKKLIKETNMYVLLTYLSPSQRWRLNVLPLC